MKLSCITSGVIASSVALVALAASTAADAADMPVKAVPAPIPVYTWTGFYGGINGGYGWRGDEAITFTPNDPASFGFTCGGGVGGTCALPASSRLRGGFGGLQAGYNWQASTFFLAGIEADIQGAAIRGEAANPPFGLVLGTAQIRTEQVIEWFGTVRGRLGFLPTDRLLIYGTGGFAFGGVKENTLFISSGGQAGAAGGFSFDCSVGPFCFAGQSTRTALGWTAGAGVEFAAWQNVTFKAEYLYVNLGGGHSQLLVAQSTAAFGGAPASFTTSYGKPGFNLFRVGLNYHFDPPVVAKY
jgi:outer membrane immunogenic protein